MKNKSMWFSILAFFLFTLSVPNNEFEFGLSSAHAGCDGVCDRDTGEAKDARETTEKSADATKSTQSAVQDEVIEAVDYAAKAIGLSQVAGDSLEVHDSMAVDIHSVTERLHQADL